MTTRVENAAAGGGEEEDGKLDFRRPSPIPSSRMVGTTRRRRGSAHTGSRGSTMTESRNPNSLFLRMPCGSWARLWSRSNLIVLIPQTFSAVAIGCK